MIFLKYPFPTFKETLMKPKLSALAISALLAACSAVPQHNEQAKALLDKGIALYQKQDYQHAMPYFEQA